jgi:hypothetical protein
VLLGEGLPVQVKIFQVFRVRHPRGWFGQNVWPVWANKSINVLDLEGASELVQPIPRCVGYGDTDRVGDRGHKGVQHIHHLRCLIHVEY